MLQQYSKEMLLLESFCNPEIDNAKLQIGFYTNISNRIKNG